jgi:hypothetical protein
MTEKEMLTKRTMVLFRDNSVIPEFLGSSSAIALVPDPVSEKTWIWHLSKTGWSAMRQVDPRMLFEKIALKMKIKFRILYGIWTKTHK